MEIKKILIAGEGGQGAQSIAEILASAASKSGLETSYIPNFGVEQRGGVSLAFLQVSSSPIRYPRFEKANVIVIMGDRSVGAIKKYLKDDSFLIFDSSFVDDRLISAFKGQIHNYLAIPAKSLAGEKFSLKATNMIILGATSQQLGEINTDSIAAAITEKFKSHPEFNEQNISAFKLGLEYHGGETMEGYHAPELTNQFSDDAKTWERFPQYCKGCGLCIENCPKKALKFSKDLNFLGTNLPEVDISACIACGQCEQICPDGAIKVTKK